MSGEELYALYIVGVLVGLCVIILVITQVSEWKVRRRIAKYYVSVNSFEHQHPSIRIDFNLDTEPVADTCLHVVCRDEAGNHYMPRTLPLLPFQGNRYTINRDVVGRNEKMEVLFVLIRGNAASFINGYALHPDGYQFIGPGLPSHIHVLKTSQQMFINDEPAPATDATSLAE
jgi:hypothetical protein